MTVVPERRTPEQVREDIRTERRELHAAIGTLSREAKRSATLAGALVGAGVAALVLWRLSRALRRA